MSSQLKYNQLHKIRNIGGAQTQLHKPSPRKSLTDHINYLRRSSTDSEASNMNNPVDIAPAWANQLMQKVELSLERTESVHKRVDEQQTLLEGVMRTTDTHSEHLVQLQTEIQGLKARMVDIETTRDLHYAEAQRLELHLNGNKAVIRGPHDIQLYEKFRHRRTDELMPQVSTFLMSILGDAIPDIVAIEPKGGKVRNKANTFIVEFKNKQDMNKIFNKKLTEGLRKINNGKPPKDWVYIDHFLPVGFVKMQEYTQKIVKAYNQTNVIPANRAQIRPYGAITVGAQFFQYDAINSDMPLLGPTIAKLNLKKPLNCLGRGNTV